MTNRDASSVYHLDMLDADIRAERNMEALPWTFETDDGQAYFATEEEACAMQRAYRVQRGFNPMTGEIEMLRRPLHFYIA